MKKVTIEKLRSMDACDSAVEWVEEQKETDLLKLINAAMKKSRFDWVNWYLVRIMTYKQYVSYAIFAAEQVIDIFERKYPEEKRPREAIKAAKKCLSSPTKNNKSAAAHTAHTAHTAYAAADAVHADAAYATACAACAACTAHAAYDAAYAAAYAACAAHAAYAAADVHAAADAAHADAAVATHAAAYAYAADAAADAARKEMQKKIINYGIKILGLKK